MNATFVDPSPVSAGAVGHPQTCSYRMRWATSAEDVRRAQRLRFQVFNLELQEGLGASFATGHDADRFDDVCDHLLVEHVDGGGLVGTYRMQTGRMAAGGQGYYSAQEFAFDVFEEHRVEILELGRACILDGHRSFSVLTMLWRGIAAYAARHGSRYLIGCSSLTSQDPSVGLAAYRALEGHLAEPGFRTRPHPRYACDADPAASAPAIPRLLHAYLALGARICGPPALDREFGTIDFLTLLDLHALSGRVRARWGLKEETIADRFL